MCATSLCLNSGLLLTENSKECLSWGAERKYEGFMQTTGNMCFDLQEPLRQWCKEQEYGTDVRLAEFLRGLQMSLECMGEGKQQHPRFANGERFPEIATCTQWVSMFLCGCICLPWALLMWRREKAGEDIVWLWSTLRGSALCAPYAWHILVVWAASTPWCLLHRDEGNGRGWQELALL